MSIIKKNSEIIERCRDCLENCNKVAKSLHTTIKGLIYTPYGIDKLNDAVDCLVVNLENLKYEYNTIFQEYMLYNGKFLMSNILEKQNIDMFLSCAIVMPEDSHLLYEISNCCNQLIESDKIQPTFTDGALGFYNEKPNFDKLSEDGKITMRWQQTVALFQQWAMMRAYMVRLEKIIEYLNCVFVDTPTSICPDK